MIRVIYIEHWKLVVSNLKDSAWEWWKSVSTNTGQETITCIKFERMFNLMFIMGHPSLQRNMSC